MFCFIIDENLVLPESLDRLELFFKMPSQLELLSHAYMVCNLNLSVL